MKKGCGDASKPTVDVPSTSWTIPVTFDHEEKWQPIKVNGATPKSGLRRKAHATVLRENRTTNSFAAAFGVGLIFLAGFVMMGAAITISSARLAVAGCAILLGATGLYGLWLI